MVESSQGSQVKSASFRESSNATPGKEHGGESTKNLVSKCTQLTGQWTFVRKDCASESFSQRTAQQSSEGMRHSR